MSSPGSDGGGDANLTDTMGLAAGDLLIGTEERVPLEWRELWGAWWDVYVVLTGLVFTLLLLVSVAHTCFGGITLTSGFKPGFKLEFKTMVLLLNCVACACRVAWVVDPEGFEDILPTRAAQALLRLAQQVLFVEVLLFIVMWKRVIVAWASNRPIKSRILVGRYKYPLSLVIFVLGGVGLTAEMLAASDVEPDLMQHLIRGLFLTYVSGFVVVGSYYAWSLSKLIKSRQATHAFTRVRRKLHRTVTILTCVLVAWAGVFSWVFTEKKLGPVPFLAYFAFMRAAEATVSFGIVAAVVPEPKYSRLPCSSVTWVCWYASMSCVLWRSRRTVRKAATAAMDGGFDLFDNPMHSQAEDVAAPPATPDQRSAVVKGLSAVADSARRFVGSASPKDASPLVHDGESKEGVDIRSITVEMGGRASSSSGASSGATTSRLSTYKKDTTAMLPASLSDDADRAQNHRSHHHHRGGLHRSATAPRGGRGRGSGRGRGGRSGSGSGSGGGRGRGRHAVAASAPAGGGAVTSALEADVSDDDANEATGTALSSYGPARTTMSRPSASSE